MGASWQRDTQVGAWGCSSTYWEDRTPGLGLHLPSGPAEHKHLEMASPKESKLWSDGG